MGIDIESFIGYGITLSDADLGEINLADPDLYQMMWGDLSLKLAYMEDFSNRFFFGRRLISAGKSFKISDITIALSKEELEIFKEIFEILNRADSFQFYLVIEKY